MKTKNRISLVLLFVMVVVLTALVSISFLTTDTASRTGYFWMTFAFLVLGIVLSGVFGFLQIRIHLDHGLPTPAFFSIGTLIVLYDLFLVINPVVSWKGFEFSLIAYSVTHIVGLAMFLSLSGMALMSAMSITEREGRETKGRYTIRLWDDQINRMIRQGRANQLDEDLIEMLQKALGKVRYTDPLGSDESAGLEGDIVEDIQWLARQIDEISVDFEDEKKSSIVQEMKQRVQILMKRLEDREALLARIK